MDEKLLKISDYLAELEEDDFIELIKEVLAEDSSTEAAQEIMKACALGMEKVGQLFEESEYFVGDLVYAGFVLEKGLEILNPYLGSEGGKKIGKLVIGTAHGDLHDIGKNIFKSMVEAAGFEIFDLGVDVSPEKFVEKVKEVKPDIVGISGLLTLALDTMGDIIKAFEEAGVRDDIKVIIGGNPVSEAVCQRVGADMHSNNAATAVKQCKEWMGV